MSTEKPVENIILIGMPGAGKSTVGVVLAKILNFDFIDTDLLIQKEQGETLQHIIDERGNEAFIAVEGGVLERLEAHHAVISTGGSAVYSEAAMRHLRDIGTVVYLSVSYDEMCARIENLDERGVVMRAGAELGLRGMYAERAPLYEQFAHINVCVDGASITQNAQNIVAALKCCAS